MKKSGWYKINYYSVYVEGGKVIRAVLDGTGQATTLYPYRFNKRLGCWVNVSGELSPGALRAGLRRDTIILK